MSDQRKQSLYLPPDVRSEIQAEAQRLDRTLSWVAQQAWTIARDEIKRAPTEETPARKQRSKRVCPC